MYIHAIRLTALGIGLIITTLCAANVALAVDSAYQDKSLEKRDSSFFDEFFLAPGAELSSLKKVFIETPEVSFDKRWLKENRTGLTPNYKTRTKKDYSEELHNQLTKAFEKSGKFTVVSSPEATDDVLIVTPKIIDLDIYGPDSTVNVKHFVYRVGAAKLDVILRNAQGEVLGHISDHRETRDRGHVRLERTSRVVNNRDFRMLMSRWSDQLVKHVAMH